MRLRLVEPSERLVQQFRDSRDLVAMAGMLTPPDLKKLRTLMDDRALVIWDILRQGDTRPLGYMLFVSYDGPPYPALHFFSGQLDLDIAKDCFEAMLPTFFHNTREDALFFYLARPVNPAIHELLVDHGFDMFDDNPTIDSDQEACYVLERYTYEAYYGGEGDAGEFEGDDAEES